MAAALEKVHECDDEDCSVNGKKEIIHTTENKMKCEHTKCGLTHWINGSPIKLFEYTNRLGFKCWLCANCHSVATKYPTEYEMTTNNHIQSKQKKKPIKLILMHNPLA
jgi:hypothetical protein